MGGIFLLYFLTRVLREGHAIISRLGEDEPRERGAHSRRGVLSEYHPPGGWLRSSSGATCVPKFGGI